MTTYVVEELFDKRKGSGDYKRNREYTRNFVVRTTDYLDGPANISAAFTLLSGIGRGTSYDTGLAGEVDLGSVCTKLIPVQTEKYFWELQVDYASRLDFGEGTHGGDPGTQPADPTARAPVWSFGFTGHDEFVEKDLAGADLVNSAGDPFDPPLSLERGYWTIKIQINKNPSTLTPSWFVNRWHHVNGDVWSIGGFSFDIGSMLIHDLEATSQYENKQAFYSLTYTILHNPLATDGMGNWLSGLWHPWRIQDRGFNAYDPDIDGDGHPGKYKMRDAFGDAYSTPQLLDGTGHPLAHGSPAVYRTFRRYDDFTFTGAIP